MKLISFRNINNEERLGFVVKNKIYDMYNCGKELCLEIPKTMKLFLKDGEDALKLAYQIVDAAENNKVAPLQDQGVKILAPVPKPSSCRDAYAFRQHVQTARRNRGVDMIPEFDQFPIFYFTNHNSIIGSGDLVLEKDHLHKLDFELEVAIVIGKKGRNIRKEDADDYIIGLTIMNDFSARLLQMEEMKLNLGPAKGKDFATAIGPWLVTKEELKEQITTSENGNIYNLEMKAFHNGTQISLGNVNQMTWTFAEIIERASYGVDLHPGDVIGSGTVGTGCYLELNGTNAIKAKEEGKDFEPVWLKENDEIRLEIEKLGELSNTIRVHPESRSLLALKKNV